VIAVLRHLEDERGNHIRTRNQRLAALHSLFEYIAARTPEMLDVCQQVAAIPMKRVAPPETHFLERDEVEALLRHLPSHGRLALRDRGLLLFLYNTGARAQEAADLRVEHLHLGEHPIVRLHGKGDKWRTCPLWQQTARTLDALIASLDPPATPQSAVFTAHRRPLTRSGIYKIVRRHGSTFDDPRTDRRVSPHTYADVGTSTFSGIPTRCCSAPVTPTSSRSRCGSVIMRVILSSAIGLVVCERGAEEAVGQRNTGPPSRTARTR
jgi:integrase